MENVETDGPTESGPGPPHLQLSQSQKLGVKLSTDGWMHATNELERKLQHEDLSRMQQFEYARHLEDHEFLSYAPSHHARHVKQVRRFDSKVERKVKVAPEVGMPLTRFWGAW
jgi:hypothetical protein